MIHNMTGGGGAGLKLKVIGGTSRPGGSDTLYWDGNTEGLESVEALGLYKISDATPTLDELRQGGKLVVYINGNFGEVPLSVDNMQEVAEGVIMFTNNGFVVHEQAVGVDFDGAVFPESGIYIGVAGIERAEIQFYGYTFGGGSVKDNTVWIDTTTPISSYAFSADEPESPAEGMVWIKTASESTTPINVDKKNAVILYPQTAQQYVSGAWVGKTAQVYTDGAWHELWDGYYYKLGEVYEAITGGYETTVSDNTGGTNNGLLTFNSNNMVLSPVSTSKQGGNLAYSVKAIDVSNVNTLVFDCHADGTDSCGVGVATQKGVWGGAVASKSVNNTARANVSVDVSNVTGEVYIRLSSWWNPSTYKGKLTVYNIYKQ